MTTALVAFGLLGLGCAVVLAQTGDPMAAVGIFVAILAGRGIYRAFARRDRLLPFRFEGQPIGLLLRRAMRRNKLGRKASANPLLDAIDGEPEAPVVVLECARCRALFQQRPASSPLSKFPICQGCIQAVKERAAKRRAERRSA